MAREAAAIIKTAIISLGLVGFYAQPVFAKHAKTSEPATTQSEPLADDREVSDPAGVPAVPDVIAVPANNQVEKNSEITAKILSDAIKLCQLAADNRREIVDALETGGWSSEIEYDIGNAPFYKEISAELIYEGVGKAEIWGFIEDYPGYQMGYCSLTISSPTGVFDLSAIDEIEGMVGELNVEGDQSYGAWRSDTMENEMATKFIHAFQNFDTFLYQVSTVTNLNR